MIFPEFRKIFWISGVLLYVTPFILNLFNSDSFLFSILFFFIYCIMFMMFFFIEEYDYYRHVTITVTIISMVVYPVLFIASNNAGKYYALKSEINELSGFVDTVKNFKNAESLNIGYFDSENRLNDILISEDKNIFENFGIDKSYYYNIVNEMKIREIDVLRKDGNTIFIRKKNMPGLVYYLNPQFKYRDKRYSEYNVRIDENWYAYDY